MKLLQKGLGKGRTKQRMKRMIGVLLCLILAIEQGNIPVLAASYQLDEWTKVEDGYTSPENTTIIHYLNSSAKPYTKIANRIEELWVGDHHRFTVAVNQRTRANIRWTSSNPEVASIDQKTGELTALSAGTTTITMWDSVNKAKQTCQVEVKAVPVLPEMPEAWYTVENYERRYDGEWLVGVRIVLKSEYQYLYEQCSMLKIPEEIDGKRVLDICMTGEEETSYNKLSDWGFTNLMIAQCPKILTWYVQELMDEAVAVQEFLFPENEDWMEMRISCNISRMHIPEDTALILDEVFVSSALTSVRIPAGVKVICCDCGMADRWGIWRGEQLQFVVDGNNTNYYSLFGVLFTYPFMGGDGHKAYAGENYEAECGKNILLVYPENKTGSAYRVPDGVERIGASAFENAKYLKKIVLPDTVMELGTCAFANIKNDVEIVIPASVTVFEEGHNGGPFGMSDLKDNITIVTPAGSAAESYAIEYGIKYRNE